MKRIFIVEDNKKIRDELSVLLTNNGYQCASCESFNTVIEDVLSFNSDLVLLDLSLPGSDGFYICKEIRKRSDVPIIVITSRDGEADEIMALGFGADDYITKPFNTHILLLRISSILKRFDNDIVRDSLLFDNFRVLLSKSMIEYDGGEIELTKNEVKIITCFHEHKNAIVSRDELMKHLWDSEMFIDDNTLTVNINRLRKKFEASGLGKVIETKRGQGYRIG